MEKQNAIIRKKMEKVMHEFKKGKLKMGRSGKRVISRKQAIAIGIAEAKKRNSMTASEKIARIKRILFNLRTYVN